VRDNGLGYAFQGFSLALASLLTVTLRKAAVKGVKKAA